MNGRTPEEQAAFKTIDAIKDLPTIPQILIEINRLLQNTNVSVKKMSDIIESDQVMTSKILKIVNSAFYGFRSRIMDISQAVMILGFNTVRNALTAVSVIDLYRAKEKYGGFDIRQQWNHSAMVAVTSKHLAEKARLASPTDCFVAGLLHDIGKLVMSEHFTDIFKEALKLSRENNITFFEAEKSISSINHAMIGGYLAHKWQLPDSLIDCIKYHHGINRGCIDVWMQLSIYAANMIVNENYEGNVYEKILSNCPEFSEAMPRLGTLAELRADMDTEIVHLNNFFLEDDDL